MQCTAPAGQPLLLSSVPTPEIGSGSSRIEQSAEAFPAIDVPQGRELLVPGKLSHVAQAVIVLLHCLA